VDEQQHTAEPILDEATDGDGPRAGSRHERASGAGQEGSPTVAGAFLAGDRPIDGVYPSDHYAVGVDLDP